MTPGRGFSAISLLALTVASVSLDAACTEKRGPPPTEAVATSGVATPTTTTTTSSPAEEPAPVEPGTSVQTEFRNVNLHIDGDTILQIRALRGELVSVKRGRPPIFDDPESFYVRLNGAEMTMAPAALANLMNRHVLAYDNAPLKKLEIGIEKDMMTMKGTVHKGIDMPFSMKATVGVAPDGRIRMHTTSFNAAKIPAKKLLDLFGVELDDLVKLRQNRGLEMKDDDVLLDPERLLPPPTIKGKLTDARITPDGLRIVFGGAPAKSLTLPTRAARNYMYYRGGVLRFGKLTMTDADLLLLDADQRDAFDFFQDRYNDMLVAGYSKNTPQKGLIVHMPDYATVARRR
jgi:hypothetical protein